MLDNRPGFQVYKPTSVEVRDLKGDIEFLTSLLENPNLSEDTKKVIDKAIAKLIEMYARPVILTK
jgi:hypothetical protein